MPISATAAPSAADPRAPAPAAAEAATKLSSDFETFLRMLTAQMENQDPLNPIQSADFAVQLATFSGVEQQVRTNELLAGLGDGLGLSGMAGLAQWIGMEALAPAAARFDGDPVTLYPDLPDGADQATLVVRDVTGLERARTAIAVSDEPFVWDGRDATGVPLPEGDYGFEVESFSDGAPLETRSVRVFAEVVEARIEDGAPVLVLASGERLSADAVSAVRAAQN